MKSATLKAYPRIVACAAVMGAALVISACSTPPPANGYGISNVNNDEALLRQQVANQEPVADNRGLYLSMIREMQNKGLYFASLAHVDAFELKYGAAPDIQLLRAIALREAGQSAESEAVYRKLLTTNSGAAAAQGLGLIAGARGDFGSAVASLRDAARRDPTNPVIVSDLGYALLRQGDVAAARLSIVQAAELAPTNPKIIGNLALFLFVTGQETRADSVMVKANLGADTRLAVRKLAGEIVARQQPVAAVDTPVAAAAAVDAEPVAASRAVVMAVAPAASPIAAAPARSAVAPVASAPLVAQADPAPEMARTPEPEARVQATVAAAEPRTRATAAPRTVSAAVPMQSLMDRFGGN